MSHDVHKGITRRSCVSHVTSLLQSSVVSQWRGGLALGALHEFGQGTCDPDSVQGSLKDDRREGESMNIAAGSQEQAEKGTYATGQPVKK